MGVQSFDFGTVEPAPAPVRMPSVYAQLLTTHEATSLADAWRDLETRTLEANAFYSPEFVLSSACHLNERANLYLVVVRGDDPQRTLLGLFPVQSSRMSLPGAILRGWANPYTGSGVPLVDRTRSDEVIRAFLQFASDHNRCSPGFLFPGISTDGPFAKALCRVTSSLEQPVAQLSLHQRAALHLDGSIGSGGYFKSKHCKKEVARYNRRLAEAGTVSFRIIDDYQGIRVGLEQFLALEARSWKGKRGTALVQNPGRANFTRIMAWQLASRGGMRMAVLELDGILIASVLVLVSGDRAVLWKIAYNEDYAAFSPGMLVINELSRAAIAEGEIRLIDSCANAGARMIENLWSGRISICDLVVGTSAANLQPFRTMLAREQFRLSMRTRIKALYRRLRGWS